MIEQKKNLHTVVINEPVVAAQDGIIIGNGDLSVSIYQKRSEIVWRFGKGDVWDRRHPIEDDARPLTIDELRNGLDKEGWTCPAYGGKIEALRGTRDPRRMIEVLSQPPSQSYPYPMPKPIGELSLHWPTDLQGLKITQKLTIEQGRVEIECQWQDGEKLFIECFVPPEPNVLLVRWRFEGWRQGAPQPFFKESPIWLSLYRGADVPIAEFAADYVAKHNYHGFGGMCNPKATPLPAPKIIERKGKFAVEQNFYADGLFPDGFKYLLGCITDQPTVEKAPTGILKEARLFVLSQSSTSLEDMSDVMKVDSLLRAGTMDYPEQKTYEGWIVVPVTTSSDESGPEAEFDRIAATLKTKSADTIKKLEKETIESTQAFWNESAVSIDEPVLENLWYQTLHISRCVFRRGTVPPGLFLPSTISDYCMWHGDYHTNYNIQQPFWGFFAANHCELEEAYFTIMGYMHQIGVKIAKDYCGTRGCFIQISGYPTIMKDDTFGTAPMSRMPYMTGWMIEPFWWYYLYSRDVEFLQKRGYPFIRDCALFYLDFLRLGKDGLYHAFPSCWGEEGYDGTPETSTDALQTIEYAASCMKTAIKAAEVLDVDADLRKAWKERVEKLAPGRGESEWRPLPEASEKRHQELNWPALRPGENYRFPNKWSLAQRWWGWMDKLTISWIRDVRGGQFVPKRDLAELLKVLKRWTHPNGLVWPMPERFYGQCGGWTEVLGIIAPLQEMLLQSWDGVIRVFPVWPEGVKASFEQLRAEGAFLVSAEFDGRTIGLLKIKSLVGGKCSVANPFKTKIAAVKDCKTDKIIAKEKADIITFDTDSGREYIIAVDEKRTEK